MSDKIRSYRDLRLYQNALALQQEVFAVSRSFPKEERYALTDQLRRSSRSIGANLAEAWAKRRYPAHFTSKLSDVDAEQLETDHWIRTAFACQYLSETKFESLTKQLQKIARQLGSMITKSDRFTL